jgi:hypothetical protein
MLYWSIGREIVQQQQASGWGDDVVGRISADLTADMGGARGFSRRNLFYMRRLATLWREPGKVPPVVAQIGWSHNRLLLDAFADQPDLYAWYAAKASEQRWSRRHLEAQIHLRLHEREGAALTNFLPRLSRPTRIGHCRRSRIRTSLTSSTSLRTPRAPARAGADRRHPAVPARTRNRPRRDRRQARSAPRLRADRRLDLADRPPGSRSASGRDQRRRARRPQRTRGARRRSGTSNRAERRGPDPAGRVAGPAQGDRRVATLETKAVRLRAPRKTVSARTVIPSRTVDTRLRATDRQGRN